MRQGRPDGQPQRETSCLLETQTRLQKKRKKRKGTQISSGKQDKRYQRPLQPRGIHVRRPQPVAATDARRAASRGPQLPAHNPRGPKARDTECVGLLKAQFVTKSDLNLPEAVYSLHLCNVTIPAITRTKSPCVCAAGAATRGATHGTVCSLEIMWKSLERETPSAPELKGWPWVRARCSYSTLPGSLRHAPGPAGKR